MLYLYSSLSICTTRRQDEVKVSAGQLTSTYSGVTLLGTHYVPASWVHEFLRAQLIPE